mmetsp:Transcript_17961/g.25891  ORF Transcript_17961/g.25891 Transcript_17961/m.25891 type:complete len:152 (+) Transcript_17961:70-525(+)
MVGSIVDAVLYAAAVRDSAVETLCIAKQVALSCRDSSTIVEEKDEPSLLTLILSEEYDDSQADISIEVNYDGIRDTIVTSTVDADEESVVVVAAVKAGGHKKRKTKRKGTPMSKESANLGRLVRREKEFWEYSYEEISRRYDRWDRPYDEL